MKVYQHKGNIVCPVNRKRLVGIETIWKAIRGGFDVVVDDDGYVG